MINYNCCLNNIIQLFSFRFLISNIYVLLLPILYLSNLNWSFIVKLFSGNKLILINNSPNYYVVSLFVPIPFDIKKKKNVLNNIVSF